MAHKAYGLCLLAAYPFIRIEVDMGDPAATTDGRVFVSNELFATFDAQNNSDGAEVAGFRFSGSGSTYSATRNFTLDNIQVGRIPVP